MNWDLNRDGSITISDMWLMLKYLACLPGNFLMNVLSTTSVGHFFEVKLHDDYSTGRWLVSIMVWVIAYGVIATAIIEAKRKSSPR
jgi:uncharacterized membrane protein SirB2